MLFIDCVGGYAGLLDIYALFPETPKNKKITINDGVMVNRMVVIVIKGMVGI